MDMPKSRSGGLWKHPLVTYLVLPVIAALLVLLVQQVFTQRNDVVADLEFSRAAIPPTLLEELASAGAGLRTQLAQISARQRDELNLVESLTVDRPTTVASTQPLSDQSNRTAVLKSIRELEKSTSEVARAVDDVAYGHGTLAEWLSRDRLSISVFALPTAMWSGGVQNMQGAVAKGARLQIPSAKYVEIVRPDGSKSATKINEVVEIGDIQAGERVGVTAWCQSAYPFDADKITLRHDDGIGRVNIRIPAPYGWARVAEFWEGLGILRYIALVWAAILLWQLARRWRAQSRPVGNAKSG